MKDTGYPQDPQEGLLVNLLVQQVRPRDRKRGQLTI